MNIEVTPPSPVLRFSSTPNKDKIGATEQCVESQHLLVTG